VEAKGGGEVATKMVSEVAAQSPLPPVDDQHDDLLQPSA
jgi:hypothetical protein